VAVDAAGNVYVADNGNGLVKMVPVGGGSPATIGSGFSQPNGVAVDVSGNVFVADIGNNTLKEILAAGGSTITIGSGYNQLYNVAFDASGNLYIAEAGNNAVKQISPTGGFYINPALPAGLSFSNATGAISGTPTVVSSAKDYLVSSYNSGGGISVTINITVTPIPPPTLSYNTPNTFTAGTPITPLTPTSTGVATPSFKGTVSLSSGFHLPTAIAKDFAGNIYVADYGNSLVKKIPAGGGAPVVIGSGFDHPIGIASDAAGNVYVGDFLNSAVKMIPAGGGSPVTLGSGFSGSYGVAVDSAGNVYVADKGHNAIKKIPVGNGTPVILGSGFNGPTGVAVDAAGNVYVADNGNNLVKKIPVGGGSPVIIGSGFNHPYGVSLDAGGNVYVADQANNAIKEIPLDGSAPIVLGSGFSQPTGVFVDAGGNIYVADFFNNAIKQIAPSGGYYISPSLPAGLVFDSATGTISGTPTAASPAANYKVTAYNGTGSFNVTISIEVVSGGSFAASWQKGVTRPADNSPVTYDDNVVVHKGVSPNGDGINDVFTIDGLYAHPDNKVTILNRGGAVVYEAKGYDNASKAFDGHSNKNGTMQLPGTYFYMLEYRSGEETIRKTGYLILKY
jgi:gliding motility-associated-like protein